MAKTPLAEKRFLYTFTGCWLVWTGLHAWILYGLGFNLQLSIADSMISNLLLAGFCVLSSNNLQYYLPGRERFWYILVLSTIIASLWIFLLYKMLDMLPYFKDSSYHPFLIQSLPVRFTLGFLLLGCMSTISVLWYTHEEQKEADKRKSETEQLAKEAELFKLRTQLQPHFLFNSLNSINALISIQPAQARKMVQQLSEFLRGTLRREEHQWIELGDELEHLQLYLDIEKIRFGHRLKTAIDASEEALKARLPVMLLQPLVENAIKFGLYDNTEAICISIHTYIENNTLILVVKNPFDPETSSPRQGTGFGLRSVERRLYLLFARNDLLQTAAADNIFSTTIKIPQ